MEVIMIAIEIVILIVIIPIIIILILMVLATVVEEVVIGGENVHGRDLDLIPQILHLTVEVLVKVTAVVGEILVLDGGILMAVHTREVVAVAIVVVELETEVSHGLGA